MSLFKGDRRLKKLHMPSGFPARFLLQNGRQIFPCKAPIPLPQAQFRLVDDLAGKWFEIGFQSAEELEGNASDGWTDPRGYCEIQIQHTQDLATWIEGGCLEVSGFPSYSSGWWQYWGRLPIPQKWYDIQSDLRVTTDRSGKSITAIKLGATTPTTISLPNYPYDIPADAAQLETDLIAAGYDAEVSSTSAALEARGFNYVAETVQKVLNCEMDGTDVVAVRLGTSTTPISLPNYPYSMPTDRATLQSDLRAAGQTKAVVTLHADTWEILLRDRPNERFMTVEFTPGDPYATYDFFGNYLGDAPANAVNSTEENLRDPLGNPLVEASKQFARIAIRRGLRVLP